MKKMLLILILVLAPSLLLAQTFINEDFSGDFPPTGWTADSHTSNWHIGASNNAGGVSPELVFDWSPQFTGISRFMSPRIDLTGIDSLKVQFRQAVDHYATPYTIGVATRHGAGAWNIVWQISPSSSIDPEVITQSITNGDVGASDFQICWFFNGYSYNINYWYIDDILLFSPLTHDVKVASIDINSQYAPGASFIPAATVENFGRSSETFDAHFEIMQDQVSVYSQTVTGIVLTPGATGQATFPNFTIPQSNDLYSAIVTTILPGDMDTTNDDLQMWFNDYTTPRNMVVLEIGTGTWCQYCPGAALGAEDLIDNGFNVAVVEYHSGGGGDPFINTYSDARVGYYGITGFPTAVFDGIDKFIGGDHTQSMYQYYLPIVESRQPINTAFNIEIGGDHNGDTYNLNVRVSKLARIPYQNMALEVAVTESGIPYSWQGLDHVSFAERVMMPDENGTALNFAGGDEQTINLNFTSDPSWVVDELEIVAFIQNLDNKEILQGGKIMVNALEPLSVDDNTVILPCQTRLIGNYPNPFNPTTMIEFALKNPGNVRLEVFNLLGQKVKTLADGLMTAGYHSVIWDGRDSGDREVASGAYFYRLATDNFTTSRKMLLTK
jgi:hypothetical protein